MKMIRWSRIDSDGPGLAHPQREGDVGFDLAAAEDVEIPPGVALDVPCNVQIEIPIGYWAEIRARSSIARRNLQVDAGTIDNGYRGPLYALVRNMNPVIKEVNGNTIVPGDSVQITKGERVAQVVFHQICIPTFAPVSLEVQSISTATVRGVDGFGSTGR